MKDTGWVESKGEEGGKYFILPLLRFVCQSVRLILRYIMHQQIAFYTMYNIVCVSLFILYLHKAAAMSNYKKMLVDLSI